MKRLINSASNEKHQSKNSVRMWQAAQQCLPILLLISVFFKPEMLIHQALQKALTSSSFAADNENFYLGISYSEHCRSDYREPY